MSDTNGAADADTDKETGTEQTAEQTTPNAGAAEAAGGDQGNAGTDDASKQDKPAGEAAKDKPQQTWPDNWRDDMAGGDEEALKLLKRYGSPRGVAKALTERERMIRSGKVARPAPDASDAAAMAEWRKEQGVPDEPTGYKIPDAVQKHVVDEDKPILASLFEAAHAKNLPQAAIDGVTQWYYETMDAIGADRVGKDSQAEEDAEEALRKEWGPEYKANMTLGKRFLDAIPEVGSTWTEARMPDGRRLGDIPGFVQWASDQGRMSYGDATFATADGSQRHANRKAEIETIMKTDMNRYWSEGLDKEMTQILERESKRRA